MASVFAVEFLDLSGSTAAVAVADLRLEGPKCKSKHLRGVLINGVSKTFVLGLRVFKLSTEFLFSYRESSTDSAKQEFFKFCKVFIAVVFIAWQKKPLIKNKLKSNMN